jgi:GAF domain
MKAYSVRIPSFQMLIPHGKFDSEYALKVHALKQCQEELLDRLIVEPWNDEEEGDELTMTDTSEGTLQRNTHHVSHCSSTQLAKKLQLLNTISHVQRQFFHSESPKRIFGVMLGAVLDLMDSEYGFIGEIKYEEDGTTFLQTHAATNIAWDKDTHQFYDDNEAEGLKFYNMNTLFGSVIRTKECVISNHPKTDARAGGVPKGHPPLNHFLGIPLFMPGGEMNGMVGISNKPGGYTQEDIEFLEVSRRCWLDSCK